MTAQFEPRDGYLLVVNRAAIGQRGRVLGDLEPVADRDARAASTTVTSLPSRQPNVRSSGSADSPLCEVARFNPGCVLGNGCCEMLVRVAVGVAPKLRAAVNGSRRCPAMLSVLNG